MKRTTKVTGLALSAALAATAFATGPALGSQPGAEALAAPSPVAPYIYNGWGDPPDPTAVMSATGVKAFTMAFVLSNGGCDPQWDGGRPLTGGVDEDTVDAVRGAGGDIIPSFGGASGNNLESSCSDAGALAGAYQKVIDAYDLNAIDIDIEGSAYGDGSIQQKVVDALKTVKADNSGLSVYVTFPSDRSGPDGSMIGRAADSGLTVDGWTIMPFDFGAAGEDMGDLTVQAADGLESTVADAYGYSDDEAYSHIGISSMNGITDAQETVTQDDFQQMADYATEHHIARLTYWSLNRDRPCPGAYPNDDTCSGVPQGDWDFAKKLSQYKG